jgi:hypothetical protein
MVLNKIKLIIPVLFLLITCSPLFSQTKSDFYVSYGILSVPDFAELGKGLGASIGSAIVSGIVDALFGPGIRHQRLWPDNSRL